MSGPSLRPVVLIGAARSGTKILRDSLALVLGVTAVPYDIGYVWRYGNESCPHDSLRPEDIKPRTRRLVRTFIGKYADAQGWVIEKTVGNTLRVPFVADLVPEAVFLHVLRDGVDVAESARRQWQAPDDFGYLAAKARHFPYRLVATYGRKFVVDAAHERWRSQRGGQSSRARTWGPRYAGIDADLATEGLLMVTARQWRKSVEAAGRDLSRVRQRVVTTRYEELVQDPSVELDRIITELGAPVDRARLAAAAATIDRASLGKGRARLDVDERALVRCEIGTTLQGLGYDAA